MKFTIETLNDNGSGMKYSTKEEFLKEISLMIDDCIANGGTFFDVQVDSDASCFAPHGEEDGTIRSEMLDYIAERNSNPTDFLYAIMHEANLSDEKVLEYLKEIFGYIYTEDKLKEIIAKYHEENKASDSNANEKLADIVLEKADLLECDTITGKIKVDKQIFDDFVPNSYINIIFIDVDDDEVMAFTMVAEDDEGIFMEYLGD